MRSIRTSIGLPILLLFSFTVLGQEVWFAPPDNLQRGAKLPTNQDFPRLFDMSPAWNPHIDVFAITPLMGSAVGPEDLLRSLSTFLTLHHIQLAVGVQAAQLDNANPVSGECGVGVEGMNRPHRVAADFRRLKQLGIDVRYVRLDEPLTFAHYYQKVNACRYSIQDTARRVAATIAEIKEFYPNVSVVDEEAPTIASAQQWNADLPIWLAAYREATGTPLNAIVFDVDWRVSWRDWVAPSTMIAHKNGVHAGMFITGTGPGESDAESITARKQNAMSVEQAKLPLDLVVVANWTAHPSRNLPESDPETLTYFLHWYASRDRAK